jgi:hypothetical protein
MIVEALRIGGPVATPRSADVHVGLNGANGRVVGCKHKPGVPGNWNVQSRSGDRRSSGV